MQSDEMSRLMESRKVDQIGESEKKKHPVKVYAQIKSRLDSLSYPCKSDQRGGLTFRNEN